MNIVDQIEMRNLNGEEFEWLFTWHMFGQCALLQPKQLHQCQESRD
jgi:hypothetical protein